MITDPEFAKHFDGKRFYNPGARQSLGLLDVLRWKFTSRPQPSPRFVPDVQQSEPPMRVEGSELRVTLVNHSTILLQYGGVNILTDPMWSNRASPVSWAGPRRRRAPGVSLEVLPPIDLILLSHNHYDHLDIPTLRRLAARGNPRFIVPLGLARLLHSLKIEAVEEMDWGQSFSAETLTIHSVPAFHFSARGAFDRNRTLWCGYVLEGHDRVIYFAGDTAFGRHFGWIRRKFGPPHLAFLPIGAYKPRWFMSPVHMGPEDALRAHRILGAGKSVAIHHGTFQLADEALDEPKQQLLALARHESFAVLNNGESASIR